MVISKKKERKPEVVRKSTKFDTVLKIILRANHSKRDGSYAQPYICVSIDISLLI